MARKHFGATLSNNSVRFRMLRLSSVQRGLFRNFLAFTTFLTWSGVSALAQSASPGQAVGHVVRRVIGDTVVVRNTGTTSPAARLTLVEELRITGDAVPGSPGFGVITAVAP